MAWYINGTVTLGVWAKKAGVWSLVTTKEIFVTALTGAAGQYTTNWDGTFDVDLGPGIQAFGVTIEGTTGVGAALTDFVSVAWQGVTSSGERSATPSGQLSRVTVRPQ